MHCGIIKRRIKGEGKSRIRSGLAAVLRTRLARWDKGVCSFVTLAS